jgi:hypothetical protein
VGGVVTQTTQGFLHILTSYSQGCRSSVPYSCITLSTRVPGYHSLLQLAPSKGRRTLGKYVRSQGGSHQPPDERHVMLHMCDCMQPCKHVPPVALRLQRLMAVIETSLNRLQVTIVPNAEASGHVQYKEPDCHSYQNLMDMIYFGMAGIAAEQVHIHGRDLKVSALSTPCSDSASLHSHCLVPTAG